MKCKNDPKKYYKGDEPSPKGRGYCAGAENVGTKKKGLDGEMWVVKNVKNGKRWMRVKKRSPRMDHGGDEGETYRQQLLYRLIRQRLTDEEIIDFFQNINQGGEKSILDKSDQGDWMNGNNVPEHLVPELNESERARFSMNKRRGDPDHIAGDEAIGYVATHGEGARFDDDDPSP